MIEPAGTNTHTHKHTHIHIHNINIYKGHAIYVGDQTWNYKHENKRTHTHSIQYIQETYQIYIRDTSDMTKLYIFTKPGLTNTNKIKKRNLPYIGDI